MTGDGFKIDGAHFTVDGGTQKVVVSMQPLPLPLTTLKIQVFQDSVPVDATYEIGAEDPEAGFTAHLSDVFGTVSVDYYGNALCTKYLPVDPAKPDGAIEFVAGKPVVDPSSTGRCTSGDDGIITIPNMGPNRYAATVTPPVPAAGQTWRWVQTTSLEGGHDHDIWSQEGATGFDNEVTNGAEMVPMVHFGYVKSNVNTLTAGSTGVIKGHVNTLLPYIGGQNGQMGPTEGLPAGAKLGAPISQPWVALSDLNNGDQAVWVGQGATDGSFTITGVPNGSYQLTAWDDNQDSLLATWNVTLDSSAPKVAPTPGAVPVPTVDVGLKTLIGWFSHVQGTIFTDANGNGVKDPGEAGVPNFTLTVRERDNSTMDQGLNTVTTDANGHYDIREVYPLGKFLVLEAFNTRYQTTGITYKGDNEPTPTTQLGGLVDFNFLPIIGLGGTIDWGVQSFAKGTNGGIAGTVSYDTTRNELDPADAATESYQPGIPGIPVSLYQPVKCAAGSANCTQAGYQVDPTTGALVKGLKLNDYTTETWAAPRGCTARQYNGTPLTDQQALPVFGTTANQLCLEAPMQGMAMGPSGQQTFDSNGRSNQDAGQTVNGNYGFTGSTVNIYPTTDTVNNPDGLALGASLPEGVEQPLPAADYIVSVGLGTNPTPTASSTTMYKATAEEDVNVFDGDSYLPQGNLPPTAAQANDPGDPPPADPKQPVSQQAGIVASCVGVTHQVHVTNPNFITGGGSPFEGKQRPSCQDKLVTVRSGQTTAPNFNLFTDVPIPTHFWGLTLNDLGLSLDKRSANYGEAQGIPYVPVGLYDWSGRLVDTVHTDFNGLYEALEPSTGTFNCPVPAGPCPNMYRFVGNDPGGPGAPNPDYNARFRTIAANFQAWPGLYTVTDEAPTQVASTVLTPDTTAANNTVCNLPTDVPQVFAVDKPVVRLRTGTANSTTTSAGSRTVTVMGTGFGATPGTLTLGTTAVTPVSWSETVITFVVPAPTGSSVPATSTGPKAIGITRAGVQGATTFNSLTIQVVTGSTATTGNSSLGTAANPRLFEVGPARPGVTYPAGQPYASIQAAVDAASASLSEDSVVVVYPATPTALAPRGEYLENVIVDHKRLRLQGVGPGGFQPTTPATWVPGTIIDGSGFNPDTTGDPWVPTLTRLAASPGYTGSQAVPDGAVVTWLNPRGSADPAFPPGLDGFQITGGVQSTVTGNINVITGGVKTPYGATGALVTQGGGIYVHHGVTGLQLTDDLVVGNGGSYGGGIRVGTPYIDDPATATVEDNGNYNIAISRNQVRDNGGTNLAGGIGLFTGANGYSVDHNAICGNHSSEYGGGISAFGYMGPGATGGKIANNRIWFNQSYDEGGGVTIAGELPADPNGLSPGTGAVSIDANVIQANLANDDGGGIRLLQVSGSHVSKASNGLISITNDTIANNVSAHEGGGIAIDDALFVNIVNTTIAKNITTATAVTSDGKAVAAGLTTAAISSPLQDQVNAQFAGNNLLTPATGNTQFLGFSRPTLLNDVFWDNRAGNYQGGYVYGIGGTLPNGSANTTLNWDMQVVDHAGPNNTKAVLSPVNSVVQSATGTASSSTNSNVDPVFKDPYDVSVSVLALRANPAFRQAAIVTTVLPFNLLGDYHLKSGSGSAYNRGRATYSNSTGTNRQMFWNLSTSGAGSGYSYPVNAATPDIDGNTRPTGSRYDAGSDQYTP